VFKIADIEKPDSRWRQNESKFLSHELFIERLFGTVFGNAAGSDELTAAMVEIVRS
jgi:hypothetical protein